MLGPGRAGATTSARLGRKRSAVRFTLTDRFPNVPAFKRAAESSDAISVVNEAVDARSVPVGLTGFRTLFNAFHHFRPKDVIAVLRDAAQAGHPFEITY